MSIQIMSMKTGSIYTILIAIISLALFNSCSKSNSYNNIVTPPNTSGDVITNLSYGSNIDWKGQTEDLKLDVYLPPNRVAGAKYPLILWVHGGGFLVGDKESAKTFSSDMAARGFVTAPIDYRLGWTKSETNTCDGDSVQAKEAFYRAQQDARAALRYLVANADKYSIDTNWIFIGGASAGGVTSLNLPYFTQEVADSYLGTALTSKLGPLNADNSLTNSFTIKGIMSMWGAVGDLGIITRQNAVPTIFFHGTADAVVPFDIDHFYLCDSYPLAYGTKPVYDLLTSFGTPAVAHVEPGGGHGVFTDDFRADNSACFLNSLMADGKEPERGYYIGDNASSCR
ncbi:alpha/beta hydrolase [Panacibacter ginsenosidivorans]|uniref:Alpha/beta hydrolase n=1 Tax=Panacibacter ginsenosidivorans TaxID=1813871 RepID=A0A5B8V8R1_9BACT|nr:alpha/beta hydrolase [Panacibacter ginsenosidivorans]QEC67303.1 alpha/beta hydrolase [Panacibacter ginsenosidivorans]